MKKIVVIGATSAISEAFCRKYIEEGNSFYLVSRRTKLLEQIKDDLLVRGASRVEILKFDINDTQEHEGMLSQANDFLNGIDVVLIAHGSLPNQAKCEKSFEDTYSELMTNAISVISLLTYVANYFEKQRSGLIIVITSVAGDRGRKSNYVYGTAKGALSIFMQGLRNRLSNSGVNVITIKPGLIDTPMTKEFRKGMLWSSPSVVAQGMINAIENNRSEVYLPRYWYYIMFLIKCIPENIFKRLSL